MNAWERPVRRAVLIVRVQRAVEGAVTGLLAAALVFLPLLVLAKLGWLPAATLSAGVAWLAVLPALGVALGATRRVDPLAMAAAIDRTNQLGDHFVNAWEIARIPDAERSAYMRVHLERCAGLADRARVAPAVPWRVPRDLGPLAMGVATVAAIGAMTPPVEPFVPWQPPPPVERPQVETADTAFERERLEALIEEASELDDEVLDVVLADLE